MRQVLLAIAMLVTPTLFVGAGAEGEDAFNYPDCGGDNAGDAGGSWETATPEIRGRRCDGTVGAIIAGQTDHDDVYSIPPELPAYDTLAYEVCMPESSNGLRFEVRSGFKGRIDTEPVWQNGWNVVPKGQCYFRERTAVASAGGMWYFQIHTDVSGVAHQYNVLFI